MDQRNLPLNFQNVKIVLSALLGSVGLNIEDRFWPLLISFAEKDGTIDYKYLLDRYKDRTQIKNLHPKTKQLDFY